MTITEHNERLRLARNCTLSCQQQGIKDDPYGILYQLLSYQTYEDLVKENERIESLQRQFNAENRGGRACLLPDIL